MCSKFLLLQNGPLHLVYSSECLTGVLKAVFVSGKIPPEFWEALNVYNNERSQGWLLFWRNGPWILESLEHLTGMLKAAFFPGKMALEINSQ